jgi:hypothetical protein
MSLAWRDIPSVDALFTVPVVIDATSVPAVGRWQRLTASAVTPAIHGWSMPITIDGLQTMMSVWIDPAARGHFIIGGASCRCASQYEERQCHEHQMLTDVREFLG